MTSTPVRDAVAAAPAVASLYRLCPGSLSTAALQPAAQAEHLFTGEPVIHLDAHFENGGAWAGVEALVEAAYLGLLKAGDGDIIQDHLLELHMALPHYREQIQPKHLSLTETVDAYERTRFYALDHAYRVVHGLVGLVLKWQRRRGSGRPVTVIVWNFDEAEHLAGRFFAELARRAMPGREVEVIVETVTANFIDLPGVQAVPVPPVRSRCWSKPPAANKVDIGTDVEDDADVSDALLERQHPLLLAFHGSRGDGLAAAKIAARVFLIYNGHGYYHEALRFIPEIRTHFEELVEGDEAKRLHYVGKMNLCMVLTGDAGAGLEIVQELAASYVTKPYVRAGLNYILGMHHLRYAQAKDIGKAEQYILQAVADIDQAKDDLSPGIYAFRKVFIDNGLAFVLARQGRHQEAVDLCKAGYEFLTNEMGEDRHRLHRSVLQYNIAQVYVMLGQLDEGLAYYRNAVRMDPNYPEYHNEIGNILQEQQDFRAAIIHYEMAIERSAPYPEVNFNKAVCHARLDELDDALACFDTSLELAPHHGERQALRADVLRELGRTDEALRGYDLALALGYDSAALRVNRAVLRYGDGEFALALADMNHAIDLEPEQAEHYENRAAIHRSMRAEDQYQRDMALAECCRKAA